MHCCVRDDMPTYIIMIYTAYLVIDDEGIALHVECTRVTQKQQQMRAGLYELTTTHDANAATPSGKFPDRVISGLYDGHIVEDGQWKRLRFLC